MKFSEITPSTKLNIPIAIGVAGTSKIKTQATENAIRRLGTHLVYCSILIKDTGVNEQPVGRAEILNGAKARAKIACDTDPRLDIYLGIENGIEQNQNKKWEDFAVIVATFNSEVAIFPGEKMNIIGDSAKCIFPTDAVIATKNLPGGFKENTVGKYMESQGIIKKHDNPHIDLCGISRVQLLEDAIFEVLLRIFPKMRQ